MSSLLSKTMIACSLALAAATLCAAPSAFAAAHKKPVKAKTKPAAKEEAPDEGPDADITDTTTTEYTCELGAKITIFQNDNDLSHIALRWKKHIHRLERVGTTTGAMRFENVAYGLIWIGIPSKGMLLDSKLNRQLANECKNATQSKPVVVDPPVPKKS